MIIPKLRVSLLPLRKYGYRLSTFVQRQETMAPISIGTKEYVRDDWSNVTPHLLNRVGRNLHLQKYHPLNLVKENIVKYFYKRFVNNKGNPQFSIHDNLSPVVSTEQNFDALLTPLDHVSRSKSDCYYVNRELVLRGHTTAHQTDLIRMGLNNFLIIGDVYRRDAIDKSHYPVFHQVDGVRLRTQREMFNDKPGDIFETSERSEKKQGVHTIESVECMEFEMKLCLAGLAKGLLGKQTEVRWVETTFPFTHPSWELEVLWLDEWVELLGCGIMEHKILEKHGAGESIGWAFGMGLDRLTMMKYSIPDIRLLWSTDSGFLSQFQGLEPEQKKAYRPISSYPQCSNDLSFWVTNKTFSPNDFYDLVRGVGGDLVEQVQLVDEFFHPKKQQWSHCYRITYRHMERTLTQDEVNVVHKKIEDVAKEQLAVVIR